VTGDDGVTRRHVEPDHDRGLVTVFGKVTVRRLALRAKGADNRYPADAMLDLPAGLHSHGLARLAAIESTRGSFMAAQQAIERATGVRVGKRQVTALAVRAATDVQAFYATRAAPAPAAGDVLALTVDGKGIVMLPEALREQTAKAAAIATRKLSTRLSKGEKANRKRMAEVGCVYGFTPVVRAPTDVIATPGRRRRPRPRGPVAAGKWLHASVARDAGAVIADVFDEADRRDPERHHAWVALVDGNNHQIDHINTEATRRDATITIIVDFVHVMEYLSAPRSAWLYPPLSGERLEEVSLGLMAYLDSKGKGDNRMPANQRPGPGVRDGALGDPRDMAKTRLSKSQLPDGAIRTPAGKTLETGAVPCDRFHRCLTQSSGARSDVQ